MPEERFHTSRRRLLARTLPLAALGCVGCKAALAQSLAPGSTSRFAEKTGMTTEETYAFLYGSLVPILQGLAKEMGRDRLLAVVTSAATENTEQMIASLVKEWPARDINAMSRLWASLLSTPPFNNALAYEVLEQTDRSLELKFTACLPAKLLRAMNAADIGYALECSGSKAVARAFNPKITVSNPKNMMKGDPYCTERYVLEG
jgi:hypothetical protein